MPSEHSFAINRARWDEVVAEHKASPFYRVREFLAGEDSLLPIEAEEIGEVAGCDLVHLQCHFGLDTLSLARRGARVTGLDFSSKAIEAARSLAAEAGLSATFVLGNVYDAPTLIAERFDRAYVTWGAINWLPDIAGWARVVAALLRPGGSLYLLEGHPAALALEQKDPADPIVPTYEYFQGEAPLIFHAETSYTEGGIEGGGGAALANTEMHEWIHPLGSIVGALIGAGFSIECLHEHPRLAWRLFPCLMEREDRMFYFPPGKPGFPLSFSLKARKA